MAQSLVIMRLCFLVAKSCHQTEEKDTISGRGWERGRSEFPLKTTYAFQIYYYHIKTKNLRNE